jgi:hypothetical protein
MNGEEESRKSEAMRGFSRELQLFLSDGSVPEQWKEEIAGCDFLTRYSNFDRNGDQQEGKQR